MNQMTDAKTSETASPESADRVAVGHSLSDRDIAADVRTLAAAGNDTRYEVLRLIAAAETEICVCELESALAVSQGAVSQALSRLYAAGLVTRRKEGRWRYYSTTPAADHLLRVLDEIRGADDA